MKTYTLAELEVGMSSYFERTVTEADIVAFAGVSGDTNPVHLSAEYAKNNRFGQRIAHGMLSASYISTVVGTQLPGPGAIYVSQTLAFKAPVKIGDTVRAVATVKEIIVDKQRVILDTQCLVLGKAVITGEAVLWLPSA